jgi:hypothetical protein
VLVSSVSVFFSTKSTHPDVMNLHEVFDDNEKRTEAGEIILGSKRQAPRGLRDF